MPPMVDIGPEPRQVRLVLAVSNHLGRSVTGICFNITLMPVDNQPPQVPPRPRGGAWGGGEESASETSWLSPVPGGQQRAAGGRGGRESAGPPEPAALRRGLQRGRPAGAAPGGSATRGPEDRPRPARTWTVLLREGPEEPETEVRPSRSSRPSRPSRSACLETVVMVPPAFHRLSSVSRYSHDGSETLEDLIELTATDGSNSVPFVLDVKVTSLLLVLAAEAQRS